MYVHMLYSLQVMIDQTMQEYDLVEEYFHPLSDEDFDNRLVYTYTPIHMYIHTYICIHLLIFIYLNIT